MEAFAVAREIARELRAHRHVAYIAGGAVRDHLLGLPPHDVDIATSARPEEVTAIFPGSLLVGAAFGVVRVRRGDREVEVATFRSDGPYLDGRRPSTVRFAGEEEDVRRRDFTVNGMLLDPETLEVRDRVGGRADLEARLIRAIGDPAERFGEDRLRLLRAVRFAAQLGFAIEPATMDALCALAPTAADVAAERIREELTRLLTGPDPARGLELLHRTGLLAVLLPEVARMEGVEQPPQFHPEGDVWTHTVLLFRHLEHAGPDLAWGALLHDVGKPDTFRRDPDRIRFPSHAKVGAEIAGEVARRLRMSNESRERIVALVENHMRFLDVRNMRPSTLKRFLRLDAFDDHLALHRADCLASHGDLANWTYSREKREELGEEELRPPQLVSGHDLIALGWRPGPDLGAELRRIEEMQLDGVLRTREDAVRQAAADLAGGAPVGPTPPDG